MLYDVDIEASACVLSSRYAILMLCIQTLRLHKVPNFQYFWHPDDTVRPLQLKLKPMPK